MQRSKDERNQDIIRLYEEGKTCQQIADLHGISKQRVSAIIYRCLNKKEKSNCTRTNDRIIYPNIKKFLNEKDMPIYVLSDLVNANVESPVALTRFLTEETVKMNVGTIKRLLNVMGMSFEEAFSKKDMEVEEK